METTILIVEDDPFLQDGLQELLRREGYTADVAGTCAAAEEKIETSVYHLIVLDITLPDGDGCAMCARWRARNITTPILFLTAKDEETDIIRGLDCGGDDYVTKPFRMKELLSRVRAQLRRSQPKISRQADLCVDWEKMMVTRGGKPIYLTYTEFQLLSVFIRHPHQVLSRAFLLERIWDSDGQFIDDNTLSVHISRLREKIGSEHIRTVRGVGYQWMEVEK